MSAEGPRIQGRVTVNPDTVWQVVDGQVVMLELGTERYYRLDEVGTRMWQLLSELGEIDETRARLLEEFDVDQATLAGDLDELIGRWITAGLVTVVPPAR